MLNIILIILVVINILFSISIFSSLKLERKRNRILQSFIAWIIRSISDYYSSTDAVDSDYMPEKNQKLPIPYNNILGAIEWEFCKDFWVNPYKEWIEKDRLIFNDPKYWNDWFGFVYFDFFDKLKKQWESNEIINEKDKELINELIDINDENLSEIEGEIAIYKDLKSGKLNSINFTKETIDNQILKIFNHIKPKYREELKNEILKKLK